MYLSLASIGIAVLALGAAARAQAVIYDYPDRSDKGDVVAGLGDVDGDRVPDFAVGAPWDGTPDTGLVRVYRGSDGSLLYAIQCVDQPSIYFGMLLRTLHDLDGDGIKDLYVLAVSTTRKQTFTGYIHSGRDGHLLLGPFSGGTLVEACGDVDGDGMDDWIQSFDEVVNLNSAAAEVRSGRDAAVLFTVNAAGQLAPRIAGLDDVDGDGHADFLFADFEASNSNGDKYAGVVQVRSGANNLVLLQLEGTRKGAKLGYAAGRVADRDGDGLADFVIADSSKGGRAGPPGFLLTSSVSGLTLLTMIGYGDRVVDPGDMNGDGVNEIALGSVPRNSNGPPTIFSGSTGLPLYTFFLEHKGVSEGDIDAVGDVDGDGLDDLLLGAAVTTQDISVQIFSRVVSGNDLWLCAEAREIWLKSRVALTTREGAPGNLTATALTEFAGVPMFRIVQGFGTFDAIGTREISKYVVSGLYDVEATLQSFAFDASGHVIDSAPEVIHFH